MPSPTRCRLLFTLLALTLSGVAARAQGPGRLSGVVRTATGAPLGGVRVTATNAATGSTRAATTSPEGTYTVTGLASGTYDVAASLVGFRRSVRSGVVVSGDAVADFALEPLSLQAVVVTATLREQELADVPFSIAAPTAAVLRERGAQSIEDVAANVAGLSVQNLGPGQSQVAIRGASSGQIARDQPGVKEQVGAYLDDSPISLSLFTPDLDLFDVSRVEVLRGPQGTLFGAGSLAGTVRYITNQPELGVRSSFGEVGGNMISGGSAGGDLKVGANLPLGETAATRFVVYHNRLGGYMDAVQPNLSIKRNVNTGTRTGGRAAVQLVANDRLTVTPRLVFQTVRMDGWNRIDAFNILANPYTTTRPRVVLGPRQQFTQIPEPFTDNFILGDLNARYSFGAVNLTSITSLTSRDLLVVRDAGALTSSITGGSIGLPEKIYTLDAPLDDRTGSRVFTQELRLAGGTGALRWLTGGFFSKNRRTYGQSLRVGGFEAASGIPTRGLRAQRDELFYSDLAYNLTQSALFGETTVSVTDRLDLTGGVRYYRFDEKRDQFFDGLFGNDDNGKTVVSVPGSTRANGFAPRVIASFRATPNVTLNGQVARGIRLGGINDPLNVPLCTAQDLATFRGRDSWRDEKAWNYELGAKTQWWGGRASFNASAFRMDITDLQLIVTAGSCSSRLVFNVPRAVSQGAEFEFAAAPSEMVDLSLSATFNNSQLRSTLTSTDASGKVSVVSGIAAGNRLPSVPRVQGAAAATLRQPMSGGQGFVSGVVQYIGSRYTQIDDLAAGFGTVNLNSFGKNTIGGPLTASTFQFDPQLPGYTLANLRVGLARASWETALFVNNLTDTRALLALDRERGTRARVGYLTNQPRTVGVNLVFRY